VCPERGRPVVKLWIFIYIIRYNVAVLKDKCTKVRVPPG